MTAAALTPFCWDKACPSIPIATRPWRRASQDCRWCYSSDSGLQLDLGAELGLDTNESFTANGRLGVIVPF